jgi:hypothetical protein
VSSTLGLPLPALAQLLPLMLLFHHLGMAKAPEVVLVQNYVTTHLHTADADEQLLQSLKWVSHRAPAAAAAAAATQSPKNHLHDADADEQLLLLQAILPTMHRCCSCS